MTMNTELQPDRKTITDVNSQFSKGVLRVDDSYQRRSVWVNRNKVRLIETILIGYPMPEVYFWQDKLNSTTGEILYSIVDGQQRIRSIREFINDDFKLTKSFLDTENKESEFANKKFSELEPADRNKIWSYQLNVRVFQNNVSRDEIVRVFLRLNETDKALNPQELRNAKFNGLFIKTAEEIAELEFWQKWKVFTPAKIRRMNDILIVSQLLAFLRQGLHGEITPKDINALYDQYNENYRQRGTDKLACTNTLDFMDKIFVESSQVHQFFKSQAHFYPLFVAIYTYMRQELKQPVGTLADRLEKFVTSYTNKASSNVAVESYRFASNQGTLGRSSREARVKSILSILNGN